MSLTPLPLVAEADGPPGRVDVAQLQKNLTALGGELRLDRLSRALYATDASVYQIVPLGVVLPKNEADVLATLQACAKAKMPLTARGGGTSQAGQAIGPGIVLDFSKYMNAVLEINPAERWVRVQPGCVLDDLNLAVKSFGLQFAPDVSTSNRATLGGMIANNSSGAHSVIYGKTVDHVLELRVMLADGTVIQTQSLTTLELEKKNQQQDLEGACHRIVQHLAATHAEEIERRFPKILRRVGGYNLDLFTGQGRAFNLAHLLVGSEGTLGITLEAKLRLIELPKAKALTVIHFTGLLDALAATPLILAHQPSAVEVVDKYVLDSTRLNSEAARLRDFLHGDPAAILVVEFYGDQNENLEPRLAAVEADLQRHGFGYYAHRALDAEAQQRIWKLRKMALGLSMAQKGDAKAISFVEDTAVAPEHLRDYIAEFQTLVARHGTKAGVYAHASVGCLHVRPVIDLKTEAGVHQLESIAAAVADLVLKYGGSLSGEHGDGLVRSPFQEKMFGPVLYQAFRELKKTFDPLNLLNPGKIVDAPPLTANLRYGPSYNTPNVPTTFDFSADGGIVGAAELCAGVGACRKRSEGTMCPSYRATLDEQHSTRGRANALRLAMTGQLGMTGLTDPAVHEVLDLCLECKACKSECPTNVDMARLKAEFLSQFYQKHGLPWRNWLFGNVDRLSAQGCAGLPAGMLNRLSRSGLGRWLSDKLLGIDRRRVPPPLAPKDLLTLWVEDTSPPWDVLLFPDTFTRYYEPAIGLAALELLKACGCRPTSGTTQGFRDAFAPEGAVHHGPASLVCCGRPQISNGLLAQAVRNAQTNVESLYPWAAAGKPILACEPSCILTIKDDYPALLRGELRKKAETVAAVCTTFEEFLESLLRNIPQAAARLQFGQGPTKVLLQGHCHQRSLVGMTPTLRLLRRIPGAEVVDVDAGCCGMAGSFGYEKEHYEISRLVGEQKLFPTIRQADSKTVIVATGLSCRLQIEHFTHRCALHPAQLLHSLLTMTKLESLSSRIGSGF